MTPASWRIPEVLQTSEMDCGPACLVAIAGGFGVPCHYGELREACQTDIDGTSIDVMEEIANRIGLRAEQVLLPVDSMYLPSTPTTRAIVVVRLPAGATHFVAVWRRTGRFLQIMDPARGRYTTTVRRFLRHLHIHEQEVGAEDWREWATGEDAATLLADRLSRLAVPRADAEALRAQALADPTWRGLATLDAAVRYAGSLIDARALRPGAAAGSLVARSCQRALAAADGFGIIPRLHWAVRPGTTPDSVIVRGAVQVRFLGAEPEASADAPTQADTARPFGSPALHPVREIARALAADGRAHLTLLAGVGLAAGAAPLIEALVLRGLIELAGRLETGDQRLQPIAFAVSLALVLLLLQGALHASTLERGRRLELRLRMWFMSKIPRLTDHFFHSRLAVDLAHRAHAADAVRAIPEELLFIWRTLSEVAVLSLGLMWLAPELGLLPVLAGVVAVGVPLAMYPGLRDIDYAVRTQTGALWRFHFDALRGATAVHAHAAERVIASEHEAFLVEWLRAVRRFRGRSLACEVIVVATTLGLAALMVSRLDGQLASGRALVVAFWALLIPTNALALVDTLLRFPERRNAAVRLIEPLDADEETSPPGDAAGSGSPSAAAPGGVEIVLDDVHVAIGGHDVLSAVDLAIPPGQHIAVVGRSGAGKSSLFALLLGWYPPRAGRVLIDGRPSDPRLLRRDTAWVDPAIQLWRGTVMANVVYGADAAERSRLTDAIADGGLQRILLGLPKGLQTEIGEAGGRLSEGQGQRVRLARALMRSNARLVLLDEPFRGQDRAARQLLLQRIRERFRGATLLCVTHDIAEARGFDRVIVLESGRICADGTPIELERDEDGAFAALLRADEALSDRVWGAAHWRRLEVRARTIRGAAGPAGAGGKDP